MRRFSLLLAAALCWGGALTPAVAQEKTAPAITRDRDRDGVPDVRDRCPNTVTGTRVDATGCPAPAVPQPARAAAQQPAPAPQPAAGQQPSPAQQPTAGQPQPPNAAANQGVGAPQAAPPAAAPAPVVPQAQPSQPAVAAEAPKPAAIPAGAAAPSVTPPAAPAPVAAPAPAQPPAAAPAPAQPQAAAASVHEAEATLASARATLIEAESERDQLAREARRSRELRTQNPNLVSQEAVEAAESRAAQAEVRARAQAARVDAAQAGLRLAQASLENTVIRAQPAAAPGPAPQTPPAEEGVSAGLAMPEFTGGSDDDRLEYARRMATMLDSTIVTLIAVFRGTSGQPFGGATSPAVLSPRERTRWSRCRDLQLDLTTYATAASLLKDSLPANPLLRRAAAMLDTAFAELDATAECDNISSMISAPERWSPWQEHYEAAARHFYESWYAQLRTVHERDRVFARTLNSVLPAALQIRVPPALPPNPPYAGAAPR